MVCLRSGIFPLLPRTWRLTAAALGIVLASASITTAQTQRFEVGVFGGSGCGTGCISISDVAATPLLHNESCSQTLSGNTPSTLRAVVASDRGILKVDLGATVGVGGGGACVQHNGKASWVGDNATVIFSGPVGASNVDTRIRFLIATTGVFPLPAPPFTFSGIPLRPRRG